MYRRRAQFAQVVYAACSPSRPGMTDGFAFPLPVPAVLKPEQLWTGKQVTSGNNLTRHRASTTTLRLASHTHGGSPVKLATVIAACKVIWRCCMVASWVPDSIVQQRRVWPR